MDTVADNNRRMRTNVAITIGISLLLIIIGLYYCVLLGFIVADIVILSLDWSNTCDEPLRYWLIAIICYHILHHIFSIISKKINTIIIKKIVDFYDIIAFALLYVAGWTYIIQTDNCDTLNSHMYWLVTSHLIFDSIVLFIALLPIFCLCFCLPCIYICLPITPVLPFLPFANTTGLKEDDILKMPLYIYKDGYAIHFYNQKVNKLSIDGEGCCICMDEYQNTTPLRILPCNHHFCKDCCDKWLKINNTCPICRTPIYTYFDNQNEENPLLMDVTGALQKEEVEQLLYSTLHPKLEDKMVMLERTV